MKEYTIELVGNSYNIYYFENGKPAVSVPDVEYYSEKDGSNKQEIRTGYTLKEN